MTREGFLRLLSSMGNPAKMGVKKSLEGLPIPSTAELREIYVVRAGEGMLYALEFSTEERAGKLFNLYVKKYGRALLGELAELTLKSKTLPVLHRKTCCGGSCHSTLFQVGNIILLLKGCDVEGEAEEKICELFRW